MEKRVFIAILLSFVVLAGYQAMFPPARPDQTSPDSAAAATTAQATSQPPAAVEQPAATPAGPAVAPLVGDAVSREIVVETDSVRAVFSNVGATLKSWRLKNYLDDGQPVDLVPADLPENLPRPFAISTDDPALSQRLAAALFRVSATGLTLGSAPGTLTFDYSDESGLNARKTFHFQPEGKAYVLKVEAAIDVAGASRAVTISSGPGIGLGYEPDGSKVVGARAVQLRAGSVDRLDPSHLAEQSRYEGEMKFAGVDTHYFLAAALPDTQRVAIEYQPVVLPVPNDPQGRTRAFINYNVTVPGSASLSYFLGPKDFDVLRNVEPRLELVRAIDFGMFAWLVVPLLQALKWINGFVSNWGWSIITLTAIINLLIFPLRHRSMVSMRKMQALQPEVKAIQDRYAKYKLTDPERGKMNQEMMALYKQRGVNPASGCLPMLIPIPILFAFYSMLSQTIELRGAPFVGWITDLSRHDPYYITPVLMGLSMLWQQRMMPTTADPVQQKIFLLMPIIFTVSFLGFPAGLVLYWLVSNLIAIGQQYLTNRLIGAPVPAKALAAPRRRTGS